MENNNQPQPIDTDSQGNSDIVQTEEKPQRDQSISIDQFASVSLVVGQILTAERVEKSSKLLKLTVDLGEPKGPRQILAGIAKHYTPDTLPGRKVAVVANLQPAKLMGLVSEGMLLCASDEQGHLELISPGELCRPGSSIR